MEVRIEVECRPIAPRSTLEPYSWRLAANCARQLAKNSLLVNSPTDDGCDVVKGLLCRL